MNREHSSFRKDNFSKIREDKKKLEVNEILHLLDDGNLSEIEELGEEEDDELKAIEDGQDEDLPLMTTNPFLPLGVADPEEVFEDKIEENVDDTSAMPSGTTAVACSSWNDLPSLPRHTDGQASDTILTVPRPAQSTRMVNKRKPNSKCRPSDNQNKSKTKSVHTRKNESVSKKSNKLPVDTCMTLNQYFDQYLDENGFTKKKEIEWIPISSFETPPLQEPDIPKHTNVHEQSPSNMFSSYISDEVIQQMVCFTNIYAVQNNVVNFSPTNLEEMKTFIGIHLIMGNLRYPRVSMYWEPKFRVNLIADNMTLSRFYKLRMNLHIVDNTSKDVNSTDRFWKVRPIFDAIKSKCNTLEMEPNLSIDEQMVPFKGQLNVKQYVKDKPTKWGVKLFLLCGQSGTMYDFVIYQGSTTEIDNHHAMFGLGAGIVMHLSQRISAPYSRLYFDNWFSSYWLFQWLSKKYIYATGTVQENRFSNPPLQKLAEIKKKETRGYFEQVVSRDGIVLTRWYDNSCVTMGCNYVGGGKVDTCRRWDKSKKQFIEVKRPESVSSYNSSMGGVDKLDFLIAIYRTFIRSKKWTLRMFTHAFDLAATNSWLEYKAASAAAELPKKDIMDLIHFRQYIGESLILANKPTQRKRGRPSDSPAPPVHHKRAAVIRPVKDIRLDGTNHLPTFMDDKKNQSLCKNPGCKAKTFIVCNKCKLPLCISRQKNCFFEFHTSVYER